MIALAAALDPLAEANRESGKNARAARSRDSRPRYMRGSPRRAGGLVAPDANSTLRVTFGRVKGVDRARRARVPAADDAPGIVEKHTGTGEFNAPKRELDAIAGAAGREEDALSRPEARDVPVDFLSTVDTTGGNSGSADAQREGRARAACSSTARSSRWLRTSCSTRRRRARSTSTAATCSGPCREVDGASDSSSRRWPEVAQPPAS